MKKNSVVTTVLACFPGAGQMFLGQMKLGSSIMLLFSVIWFLTYKIGIDTLTFLMPVLWFYGFFDAINKNKGTSTEADHFIFSNETKAMQSSVLRIILAFMLIFCGVTILLPFIVNLIGSYLPGQIVGILYNISGNAPKILIGGFVLYIGCMMIANKKS